MNASPAIVGLGFCVPARVRTNDDPIFDWIKANPPKYGANFKGFDERRILSDGEAMTSIMTGAARAALDDAGAGPEEVDLLLGLGSVGDLISPNALVACHRDLGLGAKCRIIPLASEFTVFNDALVLADAMLRTNPGIRRVLIVCGCDWSRHVSYHEATCIGAADGASAAVVANRGSDACFKLVDDMVRTDTSYYGAMRMQARDHGAIAPVPPFCPTLFTIPLMYFGEEAEKAFQEFGGKVPSDLVLALLERNGVQPADICLIAHQASSVLTEAWQTAIGPGQLLTTLPQFGNITVASVGVTLACLRQEIERDFLVLLTLGLQQQASAILLVRGSSMRSSPPR